MQEATQRRKYSISLRHKKFVSLYTYMHTRVLRLGHLTILMVVHVGIVTVCAIGLERQVN